MATSSAPDRRVRMLRDYAAITVLRLAAAALALFLILRVAAPWLVDLHQTGALALAVALLLLCPLVLIHAGWMLWEDRRRFLDRLDPPPL